MIAELTDKEILDFLMTSDFNENLSPDETRFLLLKFRNFYRICHSKNELLNTDLDLAKKASEQLVSANVRIEKLSKENQDLTEKLNQIMNKKLTIKERFFGKIIETK